MNKDPKYCGAPNICFSILSEGDNRELEYAKQREERGFDDSETWDLTGTIANFIIPRLERYIEIDDDISGELNKISTPERKFLNMLKLVSRNNGNRIFTDEEKLEVEQGLKSFEKIFIGLWW